MLLLKYVCEARCIQRYLPNTTKGCPRYLNKICLIAYQNAQNDVADMFTLVKIPFLAVVTGRKIYPANLQFKGNNSSLKGTVHKNLAYRHFVL